MAADRRTTISGQTWGKHSKMMHIPGGVVALSGDYNDILAFVEWKRSGEAQPPRNFNGDNRVDGCAILNGKPFSVEGSIMVPLRACDKRAWGSGWQWAAAAMDHGASARDAVKYASKRDGYSGGGVDVKPVVRRK